MKNIFFPEKLHALFFDRLSEYNLATIKTETRTGNLDAREVEQAKALYDWLYKYLRSWGINPSVLVKEPDL